MNAMKTNHMTNKIKSLAAAALALALFSLAGCQQTADGGDSQQALVVTQEAGGSSLGGASSGSAAWITLSLGGQNDLISKTTLPSADDAVWKSFELVGTATTAGELTDISYSTPAQCDDPVADLQAAQIPAREGAVYNLTLTAVTTGGAVYSASKASSAIQTGDNTVAFDLRLSGLGSAAAGAQEGSAQIAVNLPANVTRLTVVVYKVDASGTPQSSPISPEQRLEIVAQKAAFDSGSLEPGPYLAKFTLWGGEQGDSVIGNWEEYFGIAGGMTSRGTLGKIDGSADDDRADTAWPITYHHPNDSTEVPATVTARTSYSRHTVVDQEYVKSLSSRTGYRMMGWYRDEQLTQPFVSTSGMEEPLDLYAKWFAELDIILPDRYAHGSAAAQPKPAIAGEQVDITPTPDDGWTPGKITITAVDKDGQPLGEQPIVIDVTPPDTTAKSFTMPTLSYGQGVKVDVDFLATVTFDLNKPVDAAADDTAAASGSTGPQYFVINEPQALTANGFAITGWHFTGWNTAADASGTPYAAEANFTTDAPITLYAQWAPNPNTPYKVQHYKQKADLTSYELVGADTETKTGTTWTDTSVTSTDAKDYDGFAIKAGSPANAKIKADGSAVVPIYYDRNQYTVTFNGNGATSGSTADQTFYYGVPKALNANGYQKTDYDFKGWASSPGGAKDYDDKASYTIDGGSPSDKNLYAFWTKKTFKLNLNAGTGGTVSAKYTASGEAIPSGGDVEWDSAITITIAPKSGYALEQVSGIDWPDQAQLSREFTMPKDAVTIEVAFVQTVPEGFALIQGATVTAPTGFASRVFVQGRTLTFPPLYVSDHEVTQSEYETYCMYYSSGPTDQYGIGPNLPAYRVTWFDAIVYCNLRSIADGFAPVYTIEGKTDPKQWPGVKKTGEGANAKYCAANGYPHDDKWSTVTCDWTANGYRLPSEAEWEYLARGGCPDLSPNEYGGAPTEAEVTNYAWYKTNSDGKVHDVKTKLPNGIGLYDMCGNVYEMCWDWYSASIKTDTPEHGPARPSSTYTLHVVCGSSYTDPSPNIRAINQNASGTGSSVLGFRVVRTAQ